MWQPFVLIHIITIEGGAKYQQDVQQSLTCWVICNTKVENADCTTYQFTFDDITIYQEFYMNELYRVAFMFPFQLKVLLNSKVFLVPTRSSHLLPVYNMMMATHNTCNRHGREQRIEHEIYLDTKWSSDWMSYCTFTYH